MFNYMLDTLTEELSQNMIKHMHYELKSGVFEDRANGYAIGDYKKRPNMIGMYKTTAPKDVETEMEKLLQWYHKQEKTIDTLAEFHAKYEPIHPFQDGNGRTGRMILFRESLKNESIRPFIILDENRSDYIEGLKEYRESKSVRQLIRFMEKEADSYYQNCQYFISYKLEKRIQKRMNTKENRCRALVYILGLLVLAMGLTLNTKAGLGVSPIISVAYSVSEITGINFGNTTLIWYTIFVLGEMILHTIRIRQQKRMEDPVLEHAEKVDAKLIYLMDFLQILLSIVFTRFLNLFSKYIPDVSTDGKSATAVFVIRLFVLALALVLTGIGAALSLNMRIVPNPGDGIVQAIADCIHKNVGFTKNCVDMICVALTVIICLISGKLYGIGIGTIIAMIAVGRIIVLFNHFTKEKLVRLTGVEQ